jgi:transcriptional regulator with XRE-family HTH domain
MATVHVAECDGCGFRTKPTTAARAAYGLSRHSCDKQRAKVAATARHQARVASIDRAPKPCQHKQAEHVHGTYAAYVLDLCRCRPCADANRDYERDRTRQQAYGRWAGYIDAEPTRRHVQGLLDGGMGLKRIIAVGGTNSGQLWKLMYGKTRPDGTRVPTKRIRPDVAQRLLAVQLDLADGAKVPSVGTARRVQALVAVGWSMSKIAARLGIARANFTPIAHGTRGVTVKTARDVAALYDELWDVEPPRDNHRDRIAYSRAVNYAAAHGWAPPLAWDEDALDDPQATPDLGESGPKRAGRPIEHLVEDIEWLLTEVDAMATADHLANRLGYTDRSAIQNALSRAGRQDLLDTLARNAELLGHGIRRRSA